MLVSIIDMAALFADDGAEAESGFEVGIALHGAMQEMLCVLILNCFILYYEGMIRR